MYHGLYKLPNPANKCKYIPLNYVSMVSVNYPSLQIDDSKCDLHLYINDFWVNNHSFKTTLLPYNFLCLTNNKLQFF